jgi:hypothetical protein
MGLKQILQNLSWETLGSLPPSELLALVLMGGFLLALALGTLAFIVTAFLDRKALDSDHTPAPRGLRPTQE